MITMTIARRIEPGPRIVTAEWALGETWAVLNHWGNHTRAVQCLETITRLPDVEIEPVVPSDIKASWAWLARHDERRYSFVDAVSFRVMQRKRIREVFTFDSDFAGSGFVAVRPA
jgi:predicted nucleic acid-binding protein